VSRWPRRSELLALMSCVCVVCVCMCARVCMCVCVIHSQCVPMAAPVRTARCHVMCVHCPLTVCPEGYASQNCTWSCVGCRYGRCDPVTGSCLDGCRPPLKGDNCSESTCLLVTAWNLVKSNNEFNKIGQVVWRYHRYTSCHICLLC
jgi:hypothetical protein